MDFRKLAFGKANIIDLFFTLPSLTFTINCTIKSKIPTSYFNFSFEFWILIAMHVSIECKKLEYVLCNLLN
jgi:hypothetical protein